MTRNPHLVKFIIVHCSATPPGMDVGVKEIRQWHLARGFKDIGYHYVVRRDGTIEEGRPLGQPGAHCKGRNYCSVGVCYVGGIASGSKIPTDNRTTEQEKALRELLIELLKVFPDAEIRGHRDFAAKACPSFDATKEYKGLRRALTAILLGAIGVAGLSACKSHTETKTRMEKAAQIETVRAEIDASASSRHDSCGFELYLPELTVEYGDSVKVMLRAEKARVVRNGASTTVTVAQAAECENTRENISAGEDKTVDRKVGRSFVLGWVIGVVIIVLMTIYFLKRKIL